MDVSTQKPTPNTPQNTNPQAVPPQKTTPQETAPQVQKPPQKSPEVSTEQPAKQSAGKKPSKKVIIGVAVIFVIVVSVALATFFWISRAPTHEWVNVTNQTSTSFTVSWVTDEEIKGVVIYSDENNFLPGPLAQLGMDIATDDRVESDESEDGEYYTHHVTVSGLDPRSQYYFMVGDGIRFSADPYNELDELQVLTLEEEDDLVPPNPIYGKIHADQGTPEPDSVIFITLRNEDGELSLPLSAVPNEEGGWQLDLSMARTDSDVRFEFGNDGAEIVEVYGGDDKHITSFTNPASDDTPMRTLILTDAT